MACSITKNGTYIDGLLDGLLSVNIINLVFYSVLYKQGIFQRFIDAQDTGNRNLLIDESAELVMWKAGADPSGNGLYVKLMIPAETSRTLLIADTNCHRVAYATVLEITDLSGNTYATCTSFVNTITPFTYTVGSTVSEPDFDDNVFNKFGKGIYCYKYKDLVTALIS